MPSGLALYWFTNNLLSTAQQVYLKTSYKPPEILDKQQEAVDRLAPPKQKKEKEVTGMVVLPSLCLIEN